MNKYFSLFNSKLFTDVGLGKHLIIGDMIFVLIKMPYFSTIAKMLYVTPFQCELIFQLAELGLIYFTLVFPVAHSRRMTANYQVISCFRRIWSFMECESGRTATDRSQQVAFTCTVSEIVVCHARCVGRAVCLTSTLGIYTTLAKCWKPGTIDRITDSIASDHMIT